MTKQEFLKIEQIFRNLISLIAKYEDCLQNHLEQLGMFCGTSNRIPIDIISTVATLILEIIYQEISEARFCDCSGRNQ